MTEETAVLEAVETDIDLKRKELNEINAAIEEKKSKLKRMERREYSAKENEIADKQVKAIDKAAGANSVHEKQKAFDSVKVTGKFYNLRNTGQSVKLPYIKYADDPVKWWPFEHGKVYTIPRGFADQINEHFYTPRFVQKQGPMDPNAPSQSQISEVNTEDKRYSFVPVSF